MDPVKGPWQKCGLDEGPFRPFCSTRHPIMEPINSRAIALRSKPFLRCMCEYTLDAFRQYRIGRYKGSSPTIICSRNSHFYQIPEGTCLVELERKGLGEIRPSIVSMRTEINLRPSPGHFSSDGLSLLTRFNQDKWTLRA